MIKKKPRYKLNPKEVLKDLMDRALVRGYLIAHPEVDQVQHAIQEGRDLPEKCKPGRLLDYLTEEEREQLAQLKSEDIEHDWPFLPTGSETELNQWITANFPNAKRIR